jgi:hypothetical protein
MPFLSHAPIAPRPQGLELVPEGKRQVSGDFEELPLDSQNEKDLVLLKNGDFLSGELHAIEKGDVRFAADMIEGILRIPPESLKRVTLKKRTPTEKAGRDRIVLNEGGCFPATIDRMEDNKLFFRAGAVQDSSEMALRTDDVASIALDFEPLALLATDFEDQGNMPFAGNEGEWVIYRGKFVQSDSGQHAATAHAQLRQWGRLRYSWTLDMPEWGRAGFYFLASSSNAVEKGSSYFVQLEHGRLVFSKTERGTAAVFSCPVAATMSRAKFRVECDCGTGEIILALYGQEVARIRDRKPIQSGEYVILRADGRAAFDDVRVEQVGGEPTPWDETATDVLVLKNGDSISSSVKHISQSEVVVVGERESPEAKVERSKVSRIGFGGRRTKTVKAPSVVFWNDDRLAGKVVAVDGRVVVLESETVGTLRFDLGFVKGIVFGD